MTDVKDDALSRHKTRVATATGMREDTPRSEGRLSLRVHLGLFILSSGLGTGLIVVAPTLSMTTQASVLVTCAIMLIFAALSYRAAMRPLDQSWETVGDNCYYLGFLFTLASLGSALTEIGAIDETSGVQDLLARFGIALATTIFGMFLRILILQSRPLGSGDQRRAEEALTHATLKLALSLQESIQYLAAVRKETSEQLRKATDAAEKRLLASTKKQTDALDTIIQGLEQRQLRLLERLDTQLGGLTFDTSGAVEGVRDFSRALDERVEALSKTLEDLAARGEVMGEAWAETVRRQADLAEGVSQARLRFEALAGALEGLARTGPAIEAWASALEKTARASESDATAIARARLEIEQERSSINSIALDIKAERDQARLAVIAAYTDLTGVASYLIDRLESGSARDDRIA